MSMGLDEWDLPSDASMISWIEEHVIGVLYESDLWCVYRLCSGSKVGDVIASAPTWRMAVETAMRKEPNP